MESLHYAYDKNQYLITIKTKIKGSDEEKLIRKYRYNERGKLFTIVDFTDYRDKNESYVARFYEYDALNRVSSMIYKSGTSTGLYYLNARYYDPENGRFLTEDTYRGEVNEPDTLHLYAYCKNNPINYVDPRGHLALEIAVAYMAGSVIIAWGVYYVFTNSYRWNGKTYYRYRLPKLRLPKIRSRKARIHKSKGGKQRIRDTGLRSKTDKEIEEYKSGKLSKKDKKRYSKEQKARELRNKAKRKSNK